MSNVAVISRTIVVIGTLVFLVGCFGNKRAKVCDKPREYHAAESIADLQVPDDLDPPNPDIGLKIPDAPSDGPSGEELYAEGTPCLDRPPDFFDTSID